MHVELEVPTTRLHALHRFTRSRICDEIDAMLYPHAKVQVSNFVGPFHGNEGHFTVSEAQGPVTMEIEKPLIGGKRLASIPLYIGGTHALFWIIDLKWTPIF